MSEHFKQSWILKGEELLGIREIKGAEHNPIITGMFIEINANGTTQSGRPAAKAWWSDDDKPWCGVVHAYLKTVCGYPIPKEWYRAKKWAKWGVPCAPQVGATAVLSRAGGGHVATCVGFTEDGRALLQGGNQDDAFNIKPFAMNRIKRWRLPIGVRHRNQYVVLNYDGTEVASMA